MASTVPRLVFWTPRVLCILFAVFTSLFALDVFHEGGSFWGTALALFMHLLPTALVVLLLALAWHSEMVGAITFLTLGVLYIVGFWGRFHWSVYAVISGTLFIVGGFFLANSVLKSKAASASEEAAAH